MMNVLIYTLAFSVSVDALRLQPQEAEGKKYDIFINTFKNNCLQNIIDHYSNCSKAALRVTWSEQRTPPEWLLDLEKSGQVKVDRYPTTALTNRFQYQELQTPNNAAFVVDDDMLYSCRAVDKAFDLFIKDTKKMVGFSPRFLDGAGYDCGKAYHNFRANTLFATKGAFINPELMQQFFEPQYKKFRDQIDKHTTGEDILMSFIHMKVTNSSVVPLLLSDKQDVRGKGCAGRKPLKTRQDKYAVRYSLVKQLHDFFSKQGMHLKSTPLVWLDSIHKGHAIEVYRADTPRTYIEVPDDIEDMTNVEE